MFRPQLAPSRGGWILIESIVLRQLFHKKDQADGGNLRARNKVPVKRDKLTVVTS